MRLAELIEAIGSDLDRSDIDTKIKRWIQLSLDQVYNLVASKDTQRTASTTTTTGQEKLSLPLDFYSLISLDYVPGDETGYVLNWMLPERFFFAYTDQTLSREPIDFTIYENEIYLSPIPDDAYSLSLRYHEAAPNIYIHATTYTDSDTAASTGVQIYLDEDAYGTGYGKLYFVSPTETDALFQVSTVNGHTHDVTVYHSADAATLGVPCYFDEDATNAEDRNLFVSAVAKDSVIWTEPNRKHRHFIRFVDTQNASSLGVSMYLDEDATPKTAKILFVSPTDTSGTSDGILSPDDSLPPFVENYHSAIYSFALGRGYLFSRMFKAANAERKNAQLSLAAVLDSNQRRGKGTIEAKPFRTRRRLFGEYWNNPWVR